MFKKALAISLAILTLSASSTMVHGLRLEERVQNPETLSLYMCSLKYDNSKYIDLLNTLYVADVKNEYELVYKDQLSKNEDDNSAIEMLEEINYFLQKCNDSNVMTKKARRIKCFFNIFSLMTIDNGNETYLYNDLITLSEGSKLLPISEDKLDDIIYYFPLSQYCEHDMRTNLGKFLEVKLDSRRIEEFADLLDSSIKSQIEIKSTKASDSYEEWELYDEEWSCQASESSE